MRTVSVAVAPDSAAAIFGPYRRSISPVGRCQSKCIGSGPATRFRARAVPAPTPGSAVTGANSGLRTAGRIAPAP